MEVISSESWNTGTAKWTKSLDPRPGAEAEVGRARERVPKIETRVLTTANTYMKLYTDQLIKSSQWTPR
jgi:hypothetical protein